jgi:alpha-ketoglutarate-dependent taurine dioxygenase
MSTRQQHGAPFALDNSAAYGAWREARLDAAPSSIEEITVELADPLFPTARERNAISHCISRCNMAIYRTAKRAQAIEEEQLRPALARFLASYGLVSVEQHRSAEADGFVAVEVAETPEKRGFIPYTTRSLNWHTDGYYNPPTAPIRAMLLHCVQAASAGGENALLDPEIAYIRLRDRNPAWIAALMHPEAMTIPAAVDEDGSERPASVGPVFLVDPTDGTLVMRYTARTRSISWRDDLDTRAAVAFLADLLAQGDEPLILRTRLAPGEGLLCNNVLHARTSFEEGPNGRRRLLRARFSARVGESMRTGNGLT